MTECGETKRTRMRAWLRRFEQGLVEPMPQSVAKAKPARKAHRRPAVRRPRDSTYDLFGEAMTVAELAALCARNEVTLRARLHRMSVEDACFKPMRQGAERAPKRYDVGGRKMTAEDIARAAGVSKASIYRRMQFGHTADEALKMGRIERRKAPRR